MKKAHDIIQSLHYQPQFQKLQTFPCIDAVLSMVKPTLQRYVAFCYIKNKTLFIVLNHNGVKQEFDNNIKMIKNLLNFQKPEQCEGVEFQNIQTFITHKPRKKQIEKIPTTTPLYKERSCGNFDAAVFTTKKLEMISREIQQLIQSRKC